MTDEATGGKPLFCENARIVLSAAALTELIAAAEECGRDLELYVQSRRDMAPVRRLRAAVARVRGE